MPDQLAKVEVSQTRPTIVSVDPADPSIVSVSRNEAQVILSTAGPRETAGTTMASLEDTDVTNKVDKSLIYYDGSSGIFKADSLYTVTTIADGGNF